MKRNKKEVIWQLSVYCIILVVVFFMFSGFARAQPVDMRTSLTLQSNHTAKTKPGEAVLLSGWLAPTRLGVSLPIVVEINNPDGTMDHYDILTDELGHYQLQVTIKDYGNTYVNVTFSGTPTLRESGSETFIHVPPPLGCAIVIAGSGPESAIFSSIEYLTDLAVFAFQTRKIPDDNSNPEENHIWYMHGDISHAKVDAVPTPSNLEWAIETWAASHIQTRDASGNLWKSAVLWTPLTIYFAGAIIEKPNPQDSRLLFDVTDETNSISGTQLATFLDNLENSIKQQYIDAGVEPPSYVPINVIIEGSTSGDFIPSLSKKGRIVITSTDSHVRGTGDGGKSYIASGGSVSFSAYFLSRIRFGHYIHAAFSYAQYEILSNPALSLQKPQLEATGNGISNEVADEIYTAIQFLEYRVVDARPQLHNCYVPPLINYPEPVLWSYVDDPEDDLAAVEAVIIPPEGSFEETHIIQMTKQVAGGVYRWEATYNGFYGDGTYTIVFTALDGFGNAAFPITKTAVVEDTVPPLDVTDLTLTNVFDNTVTLSWFSSESPDTQGYRIYVTPSGGEENLWGDVGNVHETNVTGLDFAGTSVYTFRVTVYDRVPLESPGIVLTHVVNAPPEANANGPYTGTEGVPVTFDASGSYDPDGAIDSYEWNFGDGNTGTGASPTHTYAQDGAYTVTVTVTDDRGQTDTDTTTATIDDTDPTAAFSTTPLSGYAPLTVTFTDESTSYDGITSWIWNFSGPLSYEQNPTHTFEAPGTYTVTLTVWEADGNSDTEVKISHITVLPPQHSLTLATDPTGVPATLTGDGTYDEGTYAAISTDQYVYIAPDTRYSFTGWTTTDMTEITDPTSTSTTVLMDKDKTVTANYVLQYLVTFDHTGLDSSATGTIVTADGSTKTYTDLPYTMWVASGTSASYAYEAYVSSSIPGKRFRLDSTTGPASPITVTSPTTVTGNYIVQYQTNFDQLGVSTDFTDTVVTIDITNYDLSSLPVSLWWDEGSIHSFSFQSPLIVAPNAKQYVWTSTSGLSTLQSQTITVSTSGNIIADYKTQYYLTVISDYDMSGGEGWYDENENAYALLDYGLEYVNGLAYGFNGWSIDASGWELTSNPILMNGPKTAVALWEASQAYGDVRTTGFWRHQFTVWYRSTLKIRGIGTAQVSVPELEAYLTFIWTNSEYFKTKYPSGITLMNAYQILAPLKAHTMEEAAEQQLFAVWLNFARSAFFWNTELSQDTLYVYCQYNLWNDSGLQTIGEAIKWSEAELLKPDGNFEAVKTVCDSINNNLGIIW